VTEPRVVQRVGVVWSPEARADLRAIARDADSPLCRSLPWQPHRRCEEAQAPLTGFRLRCGDYRVFFDQRDEHAINVTAIRNRREAYR